MLGCTQFLVAAVRLCGPDEPAQLVHGSPGRRCTYAARNPETQKRPSVRQTTKVVARVYPRAASALACARRTFLPLGSVPTGCLANRPEAPEHTAHRTSHTAWPVSLSTLTRSASAHASCPPALWRRSPFAGRSSAAGPAASHDRRPPACPSSRRAAAPRGPARAASKHSVRPGAPGPGRRAGHLHSACRTCMAA